MAISLLCQQRFSYYGQTFVRALDEIHDHYLEPVDRSVLLTAALKGMTSRLDLYSDYIPPRDFESLQESLEQQFGGVGIQIGVDPETKQLTVVSPMVNTPAFKAGVLAGDRIVKIGDEDAKDFTVEDAAKRLRGAPGTPVEITVVHVGAADPVQLSMERAIISVESVLGDLHTATGGWTFQLPEHPEIGYIRILQFSERTVSELSEALAELRRQGIKGLVLDLRNDPGGLLDQAVGVCNLFIQEGLIVSTRGRDNQEHESFHANGKAEYTDFPMVVLINQYSASASEIVAAALQDHHRATVIGQRTWGKGSVQNLIPLDAGNSALKLTTYSYWRPSGKNIHRRNDAPESAEWGVLPNDGFEVKLDKQQFEALLKFRRDRDIVRPASETQSADSAQRLYEADPQLRRAVELLNKELTLPAAQARAA